MDNYPPIHIRTCMYICTMCLYIVGTAILGIFDSITLYVVVALAHANYNLSYKKKISIGEVFVSGSVRVKYDKHMWRELPMNTMQAYTQTCA